MSRIFRFPPEHASEPSKRVAVLLPLACAWARDCQDGILRYSNAAGKWNILLLPQGDPAREMRLLREFRPHGVITTVRAYPALLRRGMDPELPAVLFGSGDADGRAPHPHVCLDGRTVGREAARFIARKPVDHLACIGVDARDPSISDAICAGLTQELACLRPDFASYRRFFGKADNDSGQTCALKEIEKFLRGLTTPCLVFALSDWLAWHVVMLCRELGLNVPGQVMVLGLGDNPSLCLASTPQITTLAPGYNGAGYLAGKILARLLWSDGRSVRARTLTFGLQTLVERDSTLDPRGTSRVIQRAMEFIRHNFTRPITVDAVAKALQVSKRTLNLHFSRSTYRSVHAAIQAERLSRLLHLLARTDLTVKAATEQSGFTSESRAKAIFRQRCGVTMTEYRATPSVRNSVFCRLAAADAAAKG